MEKTRRTPNLPSNGCPKGGPKKKNDRSERRERVHNWEKKNGRGKKQKGGAQRFGGEPGSIGVESEENVLKKSRKQQSPIHKKNKREGKRKKKRDNWGTEKIKETM